MEIAKATAGFSDNSDGTDQVTKGQVTQLKQRLDLLESGSEEMRRLTNTKLTETKSLLES